jgi:acyl-[acyl-carrier-protein]-phospholipid O-acyltransferase / long-chain-fatty-acid--[acyl-carrier-protein] ligase
MTPETKAAEKVTGGLRGFWSLIVTQFEGAFNDNALQTLVIFIGLNMALPDQQHKMLLPLTTILFSLPFILFSMAGGFLADRYSKRTITVAIKILEIGIMCFATLGLLFRNLPAGLTAIFLMGVHSAFFGPSKYGLLPELLPERKLSWGNGVLELGTFVAIITGMAAGAFLYSTFKGQQVWSGIVLVALAVGGLIASLGISRVPPADPKRTFHPNFVGDLWRQIQEMRADKVLWLACLGNIYFAFLGILVKQGILDYGNNVIKADEMHVVLLLAALAVGIGVGSFAAGHLSGGKIEYGLVPLGALGLCVFVSLLRSPALSFNGVLATLGAAGFFGGFFIVPVSAILQHRPDKGRKGAILGAANLLSFVGSMTAGLVYWFFVSRLDLGPRGIFLICGIMTLAATAYVTWLLPDSLLRLVLWMLTHTLYRIKVIGRDHIPEKGGALFVCNHLSHVDALLLLASTDRHIRFIMYKAGYDQPFIKPFAKMLNVIPISSDLRPREMIESLRTASEAVKNGEVVCIFAEGQITRIGNMLPFRRGFERIMKDVEAPIIPVALDGVWGSIFSFDKGRFLWKMPRKVPYPVTVNFGKPMPPTATPIEVRQAVQELMAEAWNERKARMKTLHRGFVRSTRLHPFRFAMADAQSPKVNFLSALGRTVFLARRLRKVWAGQKMVGLLLPPSVPGALTNFAALLSGKVPVNLNYTVSSETLASCIRQCEIQTVVTSRVFIEKVKLTIPCKTLFLEEIAAKPSAFEKIGSLLSALLMPAGLLERSLRSGDRARVGDSVDDLATIIFSSGSTGDPKGVMLTHHNVGSNIDQLDQVFGFTKKDRLLGVLPFFHSFGFTGTLCAPAVLGLGAVFYPNPLDARTIGPLISQYQLTFLLATPTFLQLYLRGCSPEDFGSLRVVMTGAEKLPERLSVAFEEQFGIRPLEGYGCTECSPAVAVNTHDFRSAGFRQVGGKRGKIGHPMPGVSVRIVDPETLTPLPAGRAGLLLVRGPNIMQGYLGRPDKTAEVLKDGWYVTGDIAAMDEDGFLQITDRLSRFSKIGGEMVPHIKVEEKLHEMAGVTEQSFAVTGVPDEKKGERLVVLHKLVDGQLAACLEKLAQSDLPNLWKPRAEQFFHVDVLPYLGTGKLDLRAIRELAVKLSAKTDA